MTGTPFHTVLASLCLVLPLAGCGGEDAAPTPQSWQLTLQSNGEEVVLPLQVMNVYLWDDETWPEVFEIVGPGVRLVGEFPPGVHVGYGSEWENMFGKLVTVGAAAVEGEEVDSTITLPDVGKVTILSGNLIAERLSGKYADVDLTLSGRISLTTSDGDVLRGTFSVHCVTWG